MTEFSIGIAGKCIRIRSVYEFAKEFCENYLVDDEPDFTVEMSEEDIEFERIKSAEEDIFEGKEVFQHDPAYLETLAIYRKIVNKMLDYGAFLFHGSAICMDGDGYLFTAKSGTGKSTHTRLWREHFGERLVTVNDDKPLLRVMDDRVMVCGTPWDGKHRISTNVMVPLKGICILRRGLENRIRPISVQEALPILLQQSYRPGNPQLLGKLLDLHGLPLHLGILLLGLGSMLLSELLGLSDLVLRFLKLCGELIDLPLLTLSHDHLLLGRCQLTGQVLGLCAERVTLVLHGGKLLAKVGLTGRFGCLGGELIDLRGQTIDLPLELLVLGRQRTIAFLCLGKLGGRGLSGLSGLVSRTSCLLGGGLQRRVLLLQGLDLSIQLGNLGIESCDIRAKRLRGLSAGNCLLAKGFHRLGYLIEEVIDFIDVIAFLEPYGLESMLPNIFRRQQSHKSLHLALGLMPYCCCFQCSTLARNHRYFAEKRFFRGAK